jgi:murein DD-endopeptidase MepM/ murein hydrolase activator NlpD
MAQFLPYSRLAAGVWGLSQLVAACTGPARLAAPRPPVQAGVRSPADAAVLVRADTYTAWFFAGQVDSLWAALDPRGRQRFPDPKSLTALRARVVPVLPGFERALGDSVARTDTLVSAWRYGANARDGAAYYVKWQLRPGTHRIVGFAASDAGRVADTPVGTYRPRTKLRLPFQGDWTPFWGGRTVAENYHAAYPHQRFALDLMPASDSALIWRAYRGEKLQLTDFACFGSPVLAPAAGTVVAALDTVTDNPLGQFHPTAEFGNYVVIQHRKGEYSFLGHLRRGSLPVKRGDRVQAGDKVGECGNSGRTTAPHLHYDLVNRPEVKRGTLSLPAFFYRYSADGTAVDRGQPRRWQHLRSQE